MPIPLLLWGAAAALAATGVVKGVQASNMRDEAKEIGDAAEAKYKKHLASIEKTEESTKKTLEHLGALKLKIFTNHIQFLVDAIKRSKPTNSTLKNYSEDFNVEQIKEYERMILKSLDLEKGIAAGTAGGALAAMGAYSAVGALAAASTTTGIATLSGAAATNATLAWLGGGALSAGGFGMAGGMVALGGIVLGPALAIGGFFLASQAEEALTKAQAYSAKTDEACAKIELAAVGMAAVCTSAKELATIIAELARRFDMVKVSDDRDPAKFAQMLAVGRSLKKSLDISILDKEGKAIKNISTKHSGLLTLN
jgi:hypothetical protein